jgi:hypothetical protein
MYGTVLYCNVFFCLRFHIILYRYQVGTRSDLWKKPDPDPGFDLSYKIPLT